MRALLLASLIASGTACLSVDSVVCDDGRICPEGSTCTPVGSEIFCTQPEQLMACATASEGTACQYFDQDGACHQGVCLPIACGNGLVDPDEMCDDANTDPFDDCSADCRSTRVCRNGVVDADPDRNEGCDDGNSTSHDGCAASCIGETLMWTQLAAERPPPVFSTRLAYDASRGRVVMFGGRENFSGGAVLEWNFTHEWDGARWVQPRTDVAPQARRDYQIGYDAARRVTVMFSGSTFVPDTWLWDGLRWSVATPQKIPPARSKSTLVYDGKRTRLVMFGGVANSSASQLSDTWAWTGSDWDELKPATVPPARQDAQVAYDPKRDRIVMFGGRQGVTNLADLWEFDGMNWAQIMFSGGPGAQAAGAMAFDPVSEHVVFIPTGGGTPTTVWDWNGSAWMSRPTGSGFPTPTFAASGSAITTDTVRGRVVMWTDTIYELVGSSWVEAPGGAADDKYDLGARRLGTYVLDTGRRRVIAYGGLDVFGTAKDDTFVWNGTWDFISAGPAARFGAGAAFDRSRGEMVMFGGCATPTTFRNDTYTFDTSWHPKLPLMVPQARCTHAMAYDAKHEQVVLFGGLGASGPLADTWTWDPVAANWVLVTTAHTPPARYGAAIGYDEDQQQIVLFGGHGAGTLELEDTWVWDGDARDWIAQTVVTPPPHRHYAQVAWDYARRHLVLYGGIDSNGVGSLGDVWEWSGTTSTWSLAPAQDSARLDSFGMTSGFDGGVLVFSGGTQSFGVTDAIMRLRYEGAARYETCATTDVDADGLIGCSDSDCTASCIPCGDAVCDTAAETCASCPADCGACPATCGDGVCGAGEACPGDCP